MRNLLRLAAFLACSYAIANSLLLAIWTIFYRYIPEDDHLWYIKIFGAVPREFHWKHVLDIRMQFGVYTPLHPHEMVSAEVMMFLAVTICNIAILACPVLFFLAKEYSLPCLAAGDVGVLMPPYMVYLFLGRPEYISYGIALMTVCYALAWFMVPEEQRF